MMGVGEQPASSGTAKNETKLRPSRSFLLFKRRLSKEREGGEEGGAPVRVERTDLLELTSRLSFAVMKDVRLRARKGGSSRTQK